MGGSIAVDWAGEKASMAEVVAYPNIVSSIPPTYNGAAGGRFMYSCTDTKVASCSAIWFEQIE